MVALVNETNVRSSLQGKELLVLLKQKIKDTITDDRAIVISIENTLMNCLNTIYVDDCEVDDERLYLCDDNFEFTIIFNEETKFSYDDTYEEEYFTVLHSGTEIKLFF